METINLVETLFCGIHYVRLSGKVIANKQCFTQMPISMVSCHEKMSYFSDKLSALIEFRN